MDDKKVIAALTEAHTLLCYLADGEEMGPQSTHVWDMLRVEYAIQQLRNVLPQYNTVTGS